MSAALLTALPVGMVDFKRLLVNISPEYTVCVRGRHAVGKSEGVYQAAQEIRSDFYKSPENCARMIAMMGGKVRTPDGYKSEWNYDMGIPVLERRLSQMTEGDIIGLPFKHGEDVFDNKTGARLQSSSTQFKPCDWLITSCDVPVLLFLDERNRALEGVKQAVFQLTDSKAFYGHRLHEETRIAVAENDGDEYQVQACDPAEISRCATVILTPSVKDWLNYAETRCHEATVEFIRQNDTLLEHRGVFEPNKKYPDRRSWFKLDQELSRLGLFDNPTDHFFYILGGSMIGVEAISKFHKFVKERNREITAEDIVTNWAKAKRRLAGKNTISNEQYVEAGLKLNTFFNKKENAEMTLEQCEQVALFIKDAPAEVGMTTWVNLQTQVKNMSNVHKFIEKLLMAMVHGNTDTKSIKIPTAAEVRALVGLPAAPAAPTAAANSGEVGSPKKRGAKSK